MTFPAWLVRSRSVCRVNTDQEPSFLLYCRKLVGCRPSIDRLLALWIFFCISRARRLLSIFISPFSPFSARLLFLLNLQWPHSRNANSRKKEKKKKKKKNRCQNDCSVQLERELLLWVGDFPPYLLGLQTALKNWCILAGWRRQWQWWSVPIHSILLSSFPPLIFHVSSLVQESGLLADSLI